MRWFILLCAAVLFNNANGQNQIWELNGAITDLVVGPESAVHCQLTNPSGSMTFDDFGPCRVNVDRVSAQHSGVWTMNIVQPANVLAVQQTFTVQITSAVADSRPTVSTSVTTDKPLVRLTCSMVSAEVVTACVFRDPAGQVLQARQGVSEDRYSFIESSTAGVQSCGIEINGTLTSDLGLWRCDLQTNTDTYFGHLTVLCPWAMQVPEIAESVVSVPTLTSQTRDQVVSEGDSVTMSCSIQTAIRYCYFRARNGTIYNVRPGMSSSIEYVGAGLEAGECGVRFPSLLATDSGTWSCHVGLPASSEPEQRVQFSIEVQEPISASQFVEGNDLVVEGVVNGNQVLDYCRFVRMDGLGFTSENVPTGYTDSSSLSQGHCKIRVPSPSILEHHPWTVVAKVRGQDDELATTTEHTIVITPPDGGSVTWWVYVVLAVLLVALVGVFLCKRNRRWAADTAAGFRNSFRKNKYPVEEKPPLPA